MISKLQLYTVFAEFTALFAFSYLYFNNLAYTCLHYYICVGKYTIAILIDNTLTKSSLIHHILVFIILYISYIQNCHELSLNALFITVISTPFVVLAKTFRDIHDYKNAKKVFTLFAILYIICRIFIFPIYICKMIYLLNFPPILWWSANSLSLGIYGLQWYWLYKIILILLRPII